MTPARENKRPVAKHLLHPSDVSVEREGSTEPIETVPRVQRSFGESSVLSTRACAVDAPLASHRGREMTARRDGKIRCEVREDRAEVVAAETRDDVE